MVPGECLEVAGRNPGNWAKLGPWQVRSAWVSTLRKVALGLKVKDSGVKVEVDPKWCVESNPECDEESLQ